jgi:hypothetical protein
MVWTSNPNQMNILRIGPLGARISRVGYSNVHNPVCKTGVVVSLGFRNQGVIVLGDHIGQKVLVERCSRGVFECWIWNGEALRTVKCGLPVTRYPNQGPLERSLRPDG